MQQRVVDYRPLTDIVAKDQVAAWRRTQPKSSVTAAGVVGGIAGLLAVGMFIMMIGTIVRAAGADAPLANALPIVLFVLVAIAAGTIAFVANRRSWTRRFRLFHFAQLNGMSYEERGAPARFAGAIFQTGSGRTVSQRFRSTDPGRGFETGRHQYTTGSGKNRKTHSWGYLVIELERSLPHMLLDAKSNNFLFGSNLPLSFDKDQRLSLEGDFDRYFTLYCPAGYQRDALYVFTPDLMALLIDNTSAFDVEIIDRQMFVYSTAPFSYQQPGVWDRIFRIIDTVGAKTLHQTQRYSDDRVGNPAANIVAPQGQRLRRGVPWAAILVTGVVVVLWVAMNVWLR